MNEYDLIAPFYDLEHEQFSEDLDLYRNFAELRNGPLLELACGSGRLLIPLAREGYTITGVDTSEKMLTLARERLQEASLSSRVTLVQQDMSTLELSQKFSLAFVALGSFAHLITRKAQQQALAAIRKQLTTGGTFIIDISNADARYMESLSGQVLHQGTWQCGDGTLLTHLVSPASSQTKHLLELTHFYDQHRQGGQVSRTVITTHIYLFERVEMELLLEQAGFVVKDVYGDHEPGPFTLESQRMIFIAEAH
ncbi:MAG TPA: class I SAM-dependent methyltransferase [Ktedonobacteraceae bacterium]